MDLMVVNDQSVQSSSPGGIINDFLSSYVS